MIEYQILWTLNKKDAKQKKPYGIGDCGDGGTLMFHLTIYWLEASNILLLLTHDTTFLTNLIILKKPFWFGYSSLFSIFFLTYVSHLRSLGHIKFSKCCRKSNRDCFWAWHRKPFPLIEYTFRLLPSFNYLCVWRKAYQVFNVCRTCTPHPAVLFVPNCSLLLYTCVKRHLALLTVHKFNCRLYSSFCWHNLSVSRFRDGRPYFERISLKKRQNLQHTWIYW